MARVFFQWIYFSAAISAVWSLEKTSTSDVRRPPSIDVGPKNDIRKVYDAVLIPCMASGSPQPTQYQWTINGSSLNLNDPNIGISTDPNVGNITLKFFGSAFQGYYQCSALNGNGLATSDVGLITVGIVLYNPRPPVVINATEGALMTLPCNYQQLIPNGTFSWSLVRNYDPPDAEPVPVLLNSRVTIDERGNLFFAHVTQADSQLGKYYKCDVRNAYLDQTTGGSYTQIAVIPRPGFTSAPHLGFSSPNRVVGLFGQSVYLRCFFYGKPEVVANQWSRSGGSLPSGRYVIDNTGTKLTLQSLVWSDEGEYTCYGATSSGSAPLVKYYIAVEAAPFFENSLRGPFHVNVTDAGTVVMTCNATAKPTANVQWYINGLPFAPTPRRLLSIDGLRLTFYNVCKDCPSGNPDLLVVHCNASNSHGHVYGQGYLNVIYPTKMQNPPVDQAVNHGDIATFTCNATSDPSTPVIYSWLINGEPLAPREGEVEIDSNTGTLRLFTENLDYDKSQATYTCMATNAYTTERGDAQLKYLGPPIAKAQLGWLIIVVAVVLLLIIILVLCCLYVRRNKGEAYPVDDKERRHGHDPVRELMDDGFQD